MDYLSKAMETETLVPYREINSTLHKRISELEIELANKNKKPEYQYFLDEKCQDMLGFIVFIFLIITTIAALITGAILLFEAEMWAGIRKFFIFEAFAVCLALLWAIPIGLSGLSRKIIK